MDRANCGAKEERHQGRKRKRRSARASEEELNEIKDEYRRIKRELRKEIKRAKMESWRELIATIERDPWGLPYKIVLRKLKNVALGLTEQLDEVKVEKLLQSLFPKGKEKRGETEIEIDGHEEENVEIDDGRKKVLGLEVLKMVKRPKAGNPAPGLDGITVSILKSVPEVAHDLMAKAFSACLEEGYFPAEWKRASLVLLPKAGNTADGLSKARPICLISEVGKTLERLIADRIKSWMIDNPQHQLSEH